MTSLITPLWRLASSMRCWRRLCQHPGNRRRAIILILIFNLLFFVVMFPTVDKNENRNQRSNGDVIQRIPRTVRHHPAKPAISRTILHIVNCSDIPYPGEDIPDQMRWYPVTEGSTSTFVYSAFYDDRMAGEALIRIIGISSGSYRQEYFCQLWYPGVRQPSVVAATYDIIPEVHEYSYAPAFYTCEADDLPPYAVSLVPKKCSKPLHVLPVQQPEVEDPQVTFTICVSPLNFHYDHVMHFTENMELNRKFGAGKVVFYNHTTGGRLDRYLNYYIANGYVDVIPWDIPVGVHTSPKDPRVIPEIHYFGQVAALNDCLYRYMYRSRYLVFTDLDEVLVPRKHKTWMSMLRFWDVKSHVITDYPEENYMIRNTFFRIDWPDTDENPDAWDKKLQLWTQLKLTREDKIWEWYSRTKCVISPQTVSSMGIHFPFSFVRSGNIQQIPADVALLHHYRDWGVQDPEPKHVIDRHMEKYKTDLQRRVKEVHRQVGVVNVDNL